MKSIYKYLSATALSGMLCLALAIPASAQHDHSGGGGGGGRPAGGGGGGGGGGHVSVAPSAPRTSSAPRSYSTPSTRTNNANTAGHSNYAQRPNSNTQRSIIARPNYGGHVGVPARTGVTAYRTYPSSVYGHNHAVVAYRGGYLPGNTAYHYNHGYYGSYYAPRLGFSIGYLPYGYYPFYYGDYQYFYSGGLFYQYDNDQYTVVEPPVGAEVTTLPSNAQSIVINGQQYYEADGVYYEPITKDDGSLSYQVAGKDGELTTDDSGGDVNNAPAAPQIGDIVTQLPPNCRKININGDKLYISPDGVYFKVLVDPNGNKTYKIVGLPDQGDQGQNQGDPNGN
ncbi:hypothetical protein SAMN05216490_0207 [Mucilaginibacter mallensis]|uniref:Uncharacterized protein n=1 Tax=Mucilaginibacter mallensis TaxID=652787 RepID=A0A1H1N2D1_MUCMA|nr:DUF6515 family protein [Mucilaginibacter mallensis]SDR92349.1 hypothetical protein SAMN05216490_0207 [Mucilaginibacter mallensis]